MFTIMKKIYLLLLSVFFSVAYMSAQINVYPSDDTVTNEGNSSMVPPEQQLWVANWNPKQNYHQILLKFDLSDYYGGAVEEAKLNLYQFFHAPDGSPTPSKIYHITDSWDEGTWPYTTNIPNGGTEHASKTFTSTIGWYEIDITTLVNEWLSENIANNGLVIISNANTKFAKFYSKEASDQTKHPFLELTNVTGIGVEEINSPISNLSVYPNPASQTITVNFELLTQQTVELSLVSATGVQLPVNFNKQMQAGKQVYKISCDTISAGIYILKIQVNGAVINRKIIIN